MQITQETQSTATATEHKFPAHECSSCLLNGIELAGLFDLEENFEMCCFQLYKPPKTKSKLAPKQPPNQTSPKEISLMTNVPLIEISEKSQASFHSPNNYPERQCLGVLSPLWHLKCNSWHQDKRFFVVEAASFFRQNGIFESRRCLSTMFFFCRSLSWNLKLACLGQTWAAETFRLEMFPIQAFQDNPFKLWAWKVKKLTKPFKLNLIMRRRFTLSSIMSLKPQKDGKNSNSCPKLKHPLAGKN